MNFWQEKIKIGNHYYSRFIGGPLDGITDSPFRKLVREFSPDELLYTEMRHVHCVAHHKSGERALNFDVSERPLNYQVSANSIDGIAQACEKIMQKGVDAVDLNIGCPAKNVINSGSGSALMADLPRLEAIVKTFRATLPIPFTVKMRAGFKECNAVTVAKLLQDCGVDAIAIHPRLQTQKFEGRPNYAVAAEVKKAVTIPVIISGGVINFKTAQLVYEQTGVDGFLIGRGIWAKPWKLQELAHHAAGKEHQVDAQLVITYALKHLEQLIAYYGVRGLYIFRKHMPFYVRGFPEATLIRQRLVTEQSVDAVKKDLLQLLG